MEKNKKKQRKLVVMSVVVALLIVIGGTFAWFTSKDEVTNHLAADGKYGVSITETFKPTDNWVPGQEITKDVKSINTGNIDAFVRLNLASNFTVNGLETTQTAPTVADDNYITLEEVEAIALQAGGYRYDADSKKWKAIESDTLLNDKNGLNVFRRQISVDDNNGTTYEYAGYYYDKTNGIYYAVDIDGNEDKGFTYKYLIKKAKTINADYVTMDYSKLEPDNKIVVTYNGGTPGTTADATADDIIINVNLDKDWSTYWTFDEDNKWFYYNEVVQPGATTESLVTSMELDSTVSNEAYRSFTFDLTVGLESVQATGTPFEVDGKEHYNDAEAVNSSDDWQMKATIKDGTDFGVTWSKK